jgi:GNAT superfamily N-acetyltransferase
MADQPSSAPSHDAYRVAPEELMPSGAAALEGPLTLRDGTTLHQRAIHADDAPRLRAFHHRLSRQTVMLRFFGMMPELSHELAERLSHVDYDSRMAVVATQGASADAPIIAVVRYQRAEPDAAEIALAVEDSWQGRGIGPLLLDTLAAYARRRGFTTLIAEVMYTNDHMLALLRHSRFPVTFHLRDGRVQARLDISNLSEGPQGDQDAESAGGPAT